MVSTASCARVPGAAASVASMARPRTALVRTRTSLICYRNGSRGTGPLPSRALYPCASAGDNAMREIGHFVGGKEVKGTSGRFGDVFNPNTGEVQAKVAFASRTEVGAVIANADAAQRGWAAINPQRRARVMFKFLELLHREFDNLAKLLSSEHGKTVPDSKGDIQRGL